MFLYCHLRILALSSNVKGNWGEYSSKKEEVKIFFYIDLGIIIGSLSKLNKTSKTQF